MALAGEKGPTEKPCFVNEFRGKNPRSEYRQVSNGVSKVAPSKVFNSGSMVLEGDLKLGRTMGLLTPKIFYFGVAEIGPPCH